jgi:hypothetical protein
MGLSQFTQEKGLHGPPTRGFDLDQFFYEESLSNK